MTEAREQARAAWAHLDSLTAVEEIDERQRLNAEFHREIPWVQPGAVVALGQGIALYLRPGTALVSPVPFSSEFPSRVAMTAEGRVQINGVIRDYEGRVVALLRDSRLYLAPGVERYDVNSDLNTLEVFDSKLGPILQVEASSTRTHLIINFFAFVRSPDGSVQGVGCTWRGGCGTEPSRGDEGPYFGTGLQQTFKYPAYLHLGQREVAGKVF